VGRARTITSFIFYEALAVSLSSVKLIHDVDVLLNVMVQVQFITTEAPHLIRKAEDDVAAVEQTAERLRAEDDQLVGDVCNHLADVQPLVTMLATLTDQIRELEKYSQYLHCLSQIEDLRYLHFIDMLF